MMKHVPRTTAAVNFAHVSLVIPLCRTAADRIKLRPPICAFTTARMNILLKIAKRAAYAMLSSLIKILLSKRLSLVGLCRQMAGFSKSTALVGTKSRKVLLQAAHPGDSTRHALRADLAERDREHFGGSIKQQRVSEFASRYG